MSSTTQAAPVAPPDPHAEHHHARRWIILVVLALSQLMVILDSTVVNIALPTAQKALDFSDSDRQWIITGYTLAFGSLLLFAGRLADLFGRKWALIIGLAGFAAASALGGAADSFTTLVVARVVQGAFGAILAPAVLAILTTTFRDGRERGRAFGIFGAIGGGGAALGLLLGGVLTEYFSWRATMFVNIFFAVPALIGAFVLLRHSASGSRAKLDLPGALTITAGLFALVYGFSHADTDGWGDPVTVGMLIAAGVLLIAFVVIERFSQHALLPLRILLDRTRGGGLIAMFLATTGMFGVFLFMTYYLQANLGYSAVKTGVAFLPMPAAIVFMAAIIIPRIQRRVSPKILVPAGMLLGAIALALLTRIGVTGHYTADVLPSLILLGLGMGTLFSIAMSVSTLGVAPSDAGVASATVNTMQQVGGSIGTALLNTIATTAVTGYITDHLAQATDKAGQLAVQAEGAVHGYSVAFWVAAAIFLGGAVVTGIVLRRGVPEQFLHSSAEPEIIHA
ncbi:MFS transporter [Gryllotalpicola ginsengisoli]|uniref:MFS transporter n=1 Tax=Gryllotalpicola ginsengisoli TaxID=444608 RepID=UPI0003B57CDD|nr:MFS transporter [Gryllotalpicola ginsengisoli]